MALRRNAGVQDHRVAELVKLGIDRQAAQAWLDSQEPLDEEADSGELEAPNPAEPYHVWAENVPVMRLFLRLQDQWVTTPRGLLQTLPCTRVQACMELMGTPRRQRPALFEQLCEMTHAALRLEHQEQ